MGRVRFLLLCGVLLAPSTSRAEEDDAVVAYAVIVKSDRGTSYRGMVPRTPLSERWFAADEVDLSLLPDGGLLKLEHFNGLNGTISLKKSQIREIRLERRVDRDGMSEVQQTQIVAREARLKDEIARLKEVYAERDARRQSEAAKAAAAAAQVEPPSLSPSEQAWIDRFHPDDGWVPEKKSDLYHETVITNARPLTDDERAWLDHYEEWKVAYDHWLELPRPEESNEATGEPDEEAGREGASGASRSTSSPAGSTPPSEPSSGGSP